MWSISTLAAAKRPACEASNFFWHNVGFAKMRSGLSMRLFAGAYPSTFFWSKDLHVTGFLRTVAWDVTSREMKEAGLGGHARMRELIVWDWQGATLHERGTYSGV